MGLTASGADALVRGGHRVLVEQGAGKAAGFTDQDYVQIGAIIVNSAEEVWRRAEVVVKVSRPTAEEHAYFAGQTLFVSLDLSVASQDQLQALEQRQMTVIAAEMIQADDGTFPVLHPTE